MNKTMTRAERARLMVFGPVMAAATLSAVATAQTTSIPSLPENVAPISKSIERSPDYRYPETLDTQFDGDFSGTILPAELSISGADTLGRPRTGYRWVPNASMVPLLYTSTSGWNESTTSNDGRTGISALRVMVRQNGNGDMGAYYGHCAIGGAGRAGAQHWLAQPACVILNGDLTSVVDHSYLNEQEFNLHDNGHDIAAIASVQNFHRTNDAAGTGEVWIGDRWQSVGSRAIDVGWSLSGLANIGLDTVTARADPDWNAGQVIAVNMAAGQRIVFNASAASLNGLRYYGNLPGTAFDVFSADTDQLRRCNAGGCWNVGADAFTGAAAQAAGPVLLAVTNTDRQAASWASIAAVHGSGSRIELIAGADATRLRSHAAPLVLEADGQEAVRIEQGTGRGKGGPPAFRVLGGVAYPVPVTTAAAHYAVGGAEFSLIFTSLSSVVVDLPQADQHPGRVLNLKAIGAGPVRSSASNVVPLAGGDPGEAILASGGGRWAMLQSNGAEWVVMAGN